MLYLRSLLMVILLGAASARAVVIDNFEEGPFSIAGDTATGFGLQFPLAPANAIDDTREDDITSGAAGQIATADLALTAGDDALVVGFPPSGGILNLIYRPLPTDLTDGGSADRIVIDTSAVPPGAALTLILDDAVGGSTTSGISFSGPGTISILFSNLSNVDVTQIEFVRLIFFGSGAGSWEIRDIRTAGPPPPVPTLSGPAATVATALLVGTALILQRRTLAGGQSP